MPIKLSNNNRADLDGLIEGYCLVEASLSNGAVHHEERTVRVDGSCYLLHLLKEGSFLLVSS